MNSNEYTDKQRDLLEQARKLNDTAKAEDRDLSENETQEFDRMIAEAEAYGKKAASQTKLEAMEARLKESAGRIAPPHDIDLPKETKGTL